METQIQYNTETPEVRRTHRFKEQLFIKAGETLQFIKERIALLVLATSIAILTGAIYAVPVRAQEPSPTPTYQEKDLPIDPPDLEIPPNEGITLQDITGTRNYLVLMCNFADAQNQPFHTSDLENVMRYLHDYFADVSRGQYDFQWSIDPTYHTIGERSLYPYSYSLLPEDCAKKAISNGVDLMPYNGIYFATSDRFTNGYAGAAYSIYVNVNGYSKYFMTMTFNGRTNSLDKGIAAHELGHNVTMGHSLPLYRVYELMGTAGDYLYPAAEWRKKVGWIPENKMHTINKQLQEIVYIEGGALPENRPGAYEYVKVPIDGDDHYYIVEARYPKGYDKNFPLGRPAVMIMEYNKGQLSVISKSKTYSVEDTTWEAGTTFGDPVNGIYIQVLDNDNNGFNVKIINNIEPSDLTINQVALPEQMEVGEVYTGTIVVRNNGVGPSSTAAQIDWKADNFKPESLPANCTFASGIVNCPVPVLNPGSEATIRISGSHSLAAVNNVNLSVTDPKDSVTSNNLASANVNVFELPTDLVISAFGLDRVISEFTNNLTLRVTNVGPGNSADVLITIEAIPPINLISTPQCSMHSTLIFCFARQVKKGSYEEVMLKFAPTVSTGDEVLKIKTWGTLTDINPVDNEITWKKGIIPPDKTFLPSVLKQ